MNVPRFTVVTPVLNGEKYISDAIESVLAQSYPHWRYFIMDGGSSDNTLKIANSYAHADERITVHSSKDKGMYDALFKGLEMDDGEICCWINADDKFFPWSFSIVADAVLNGHDWVSGNSCYWDAKSRLVLTGWPTTYPQYLIKAGYFHGRGLGFIQQEGIFFTRHLLSKLSAEKIKEIRGMKLAGDFMLWKSLAEYSPLHRLDTVTAGFRVHDLNMSRTSMKKYYNEVKNAHGKNVPKIVRFIFRILISIPTYISLRKRAMSMYFDDAFKD